MDQAINENGDDLTTADQFRALHIELDQLKDDLNRFKELSPTMIKTQLAGLDSDVLFYNVTGGLARNASQQFVEWWHAGSTGQQKMVNDLRNLGFKAVIIGNSIAEGSYLELK